ncbi:TlpA disulfide reductase family protein [Conexibacter sp. JD483]|uniref:TlpA family protein disulfide reductase n=1 Tax=unclassified Conexibacter TaxID=2627773 RepID=UPI0027233B2D|nr:MULTISPECIES: TlpA disulfide reductase family protein [unclassified Conexibacter]MDO8184376.1 TlpA disulfide reductase family protein [Conexibacter sp. CPCC 205706]MDO8197682.1 TlpA disulfide reductase family protein [Conexibacter sp. CPCC 205762]MDR9368345.1 TlpA disulfide reductase family protein [Conexibacter sp. JD483]
MRPLAVSIACCVLAASLLAGCGGSGEDADVPTPAEARAALRGAPAPLAALHAQAGELLPGGQEAFDRRLAELRGHPVVVNAWGSWCGPCKEEFPVFQRLAARYGRSVAFVGLDVTDPKGDAQTWLRDHWVPYPSYVDQDEKIARKIGATVGLPTTVFYDRDGEQATIKQGPFRDDKALEQYLQRYLGAVPSQ